MSPTIFGATKYAVFVFRSGFSGTVAVILRSAGFRLLTISVWQTVKRTWSPSPLRPLIPSFNPVSRAAALTLAPSTNSLNPAGTIFDGDNVNGSLTGV